MARQTISFSLLEALLSAGRAFVLPNILSKTLQKALNKFIRSRRGYLNVPHYWAVYYHEGHTRPIKPRRQGGFLVWYRNPSEDPRLSGGFPVTRSQVRRLTLTSKQFTAARKSGKIIVTKRSPFDGRAVRGRNFFANRGGMLGFPAVANRVVVAAMPGLIQKEFARRGLLNIRIKKTVGL